MTRPSPSLGALPTSDLDPKDTDPHLFEGPPGSEQDTAPRCFYCGRTSEAWDDAKDVKHAFDNGIRYGIRTAAFNWMLQNGLEPAQAHAICERILDRALVVP